jgi:hypothetical protein
MFDEKYPHVLARSALDNDYNYDNPILDDYYFYAVINDISQNHPVYLYGSRQISDRPWWQFWIPKRTGHAWVCDGYRHRYKTCNSTTYSFDKLLHMNWGWHDVDPVTFLANGPDFNGWYRYDDWTFSGGRNYEFSQDMIVHIYPE